MHTITRRLDALAPVLVDCDYSGGRDCRERERGEENVIGAKYTPELLAAPAETPHSTGMGVPVTPDGRKTASYTRRYTDEGTCETTFSDVGDAESASTTVERDADGTRFGFILGCDVEKVTVSSRPDGLNASFVVSRRPEEGLDERSVIFSAEASAEFGSGVDIVSAVDDVTSDEPWLAIVEPDGEEL